MNISWQGLSSFHISSKNTDKEASLVIDPYDNKTGLRFPRSLEADIVLSSHNEEDANNISAIQGEPFVINSAGEYEIKGVFVFAIPASLKGEGKRENLPHLIFRIESEGMQLAHLGALDRELTDEELQELNNIDILMIPAGNNRVMSPKVAAKVIGQIEPRVVIPMTYALTNLKEKLESVDEFCKAMGACRQEASAKFKIQRKDLPEDDMLIMKLER
jgi:L-ascorbate metabolism protein UlaG (beta-lactamase superfamily)